MYDILRSAHSGLRWLVLAALVIAIVNSFGKTKGGVTFANKDKKKALFALIFTHIQFLIGLVLYFISPKVVFSGASMKDDVLRFFLVEHVSLMVLAIILITVGYSKAKRTAMDGKKFKTIMVYYIIGLILILASIPWPFRNLGGSWY
ncbi:cytochrome B [Fulvivirga lutimaris]|uniref:cytochrome B n=1 Tax=Fulvivirga lutimaris TaxID=1819566 RepID=UPI0012BD301F|nr:cytochrome B [Fulvivirga lutimaris]MTI39589.1 cytochrome B [Fulvivirga lutimaris]